MSNTNETVAEIVKEMLERGKDKRTDNGAWLRSESVGLMIEDFANAVNSAHDREVAAKDDERLTVVAIYENVIAAKDREIAELRERLEIAEKFAAEMKESTNSLVRACGHQMILRLQGEGGNNEGK